MWPFKGAIYVIFSLLDFWEKQILFTGRANGAVMLIHVNVLVLPRFRTEMKGYCILLP